MIEQRRELVGMYSVSDGCEKRVEQVSNERTCNQAHLGQWTLTVDPQSKHHVSDQGHPKSRIKMSFFLTSRALNMT